MRLRGDQRLQEIADATRVHAKIADTDTADGTHVDARVAAACRRHNPYDLNGP